VGSDRQFFDLLKVLNIDPVKFEQKFSTNHRRVENREELGRVLGERIIHLNAGELLLKIHAYKIPAGIIQNVREVFEMKEAKELLIKNDGLTDVKSFVAVSAHWHIDKLTPPPHFGEHTDEIVLSYGAV
jgi:crotonobetainyl-CoA:carnitine CoA-transferase CaiB-like acyl-CoA transferase